MTNFQLLKLNIFWDIEFEVWIDHYYHTRHIFAMGSFWVETFWICTTMGGSDSYSIVLFIGCQARFLLLPLSQKSQVVFHNCDARFNFDLLCANISERQNCVSAYLGNGWMKLNSVKRKQFLLIRGALTINFVIWNAFYLVKKSLLSLKGLNRPLLSY